MSLLKNKYDVIDSNYFGRILRGRKKLFKLFKYTVYEKCIWNSLDMRRCEVELIVYVKVYKCTIKMWLKYLISEVTSINEVCAWQWTHINVTKIHQFRRVCSFFYPFTETLPIQFTENDFHSTVFRYTYHAEVESWTNHRLAVEIKTVFVVRSIFVFLQIYK